MRKTARWSAILILSISAAARADNRPPETARRDVREKIVSSSRQVTCDPVCELKSQDAAFGLLIEVFRQHQAYRIETDFQVRLQQAAEANQNKNDSLVIESDSKGLRMLRQFVLTLARRERDLRLARMETQVVNFQSAYTCVRKIDEDYVGEKIPRDFDQKKAQEKLQEFVAIAPGTMIDGEVGHVTTIPLHSVLMNPPPGPTNPGELVEPCD